MTFRWRDEEGSPRLAPGAVLLSCFPSAGLAATVAALYMIRTLRLPRIGLFDSSEMPPIAVIQGGEVNPPIRVYGRPDLGVVISEFPPTPSQAASLAAAVLAGAVERGVGWVLGLEGVVPHPIEDADGQPAEKLWCAFSSATPAVRELFRSSGAVPLEDGVIGGISGSLLVQGIGQKLPIAVLLVSAQESEGYPDHRAAASLIEAVDRVLPKVRIDTGPLRAQAEQIEKALRTSMKSHPRRSTDEPPAPATAEMYR